MDSGVIRFAMPIAARCQAMLLHLGAQGNIQTKLTRAITATELDKVLTKMGG